MRISLAIVGCIVALVGCATKQTHESTDTDYELPVIIGDLHLPIGREVTIRGYKFTSGSFRDFFRVQSIDGQPQDLPVDLYIPSIDQWPEKTTATFRGYETAAFRVVAVYDKSAYKTNKTFFNRFQVLEILEPTGLSLGAER